MQTVDKESFVAYNHGVFLSLKDGKRLVVDELECIAAEEALLIGERVALTEHGKIISTCTLKDHNINETPMED